MPALSICMRVVVSLLLYASPRAELTYMTAVQANATSSATPFALTADHVAFGNGYAFTTRGFNAGIPGPTFRMQPGETLYINLKNNLDAKNNVDCTLTTSEFCMAATTNLHTHGLHISSKGMEDGLSYYSDDIFASIAPGASASFQFSIPDYHMGGTHWYHPHSHHATALQAGGGMAGVIIVEDPSDYLPTEYSSMTEKILFISGHNLNTLETMAESSKSTLMADAGTNAAAANLDTNVFLVNGQMGETMSIESHTWYRFRMLYAAVEQTLQLSVGGDATCTLKLLAKDGVYLNTFPRDITTIYLFPGARADVAISCTCATYPCSGSLTSGAGRRLQPGRGGRMGGGGAGPGAAGGDVVAVNIMTLAVSNSGASSATPLPTTSVTRPCYLADLRSATADGTGTVELRGGPRAVAWNGAGTSMTYANVHASEGTMLTWPALTSFATGTIQELTVTGAHAHPYHMHVNPYQVTSMPANSYSDGYFQVGDWHDTLMITDLAQADSITVRMNMDRFTGKMVVHCHILEHEDEGMMAYITISGTEGATYASAAALDSTCYSSAYNGSATSSKSATSSPESGEASSANVHAPAACDAIKFVVATTSIGLLMA